LRRVAGEIEGKTMEIVAHKHEDRERMMNVIQDKTGMIFVDASNFPNMKKPSCDKENIGVQRIVQLDKMLNVLKPNSEDALCFAVFVQGRPKMHVHTYGDIQTLISPVIAVKKRGQTGMDVDNPKIKCARKFEKVNAKDIPRRRAKILASKLILNIMNKNQINSEDSKIAKKENTINLPLHFLNQLRKVAGEIESKSMEIVEHKHDETKTMMKVIEDKSGIIFVDETNFSHMRKPSENKKNTGVQRIVKLGMIMDILNKKSEDATCFAVFMPGCQKMHVHTFGGLETMTSSVIAVKKNPKLSMGVESPTFNGTEEIKKVDSRNVQRKRAKCLASKLIMKIINKKQTPLQDPNTVKDEKCKKGKELTNKINLPIHIIHQLRMVNGEIEGKTLDIVLHEHKDMKTVKDIMREKTGILIVDGSFNTGGFEGPKQGGDLKFTEIQRIMKLDKIEENLEISQKCCESLIYVVIMRGRKKVHCHVVGSVTDIVFPIMAFNKKAMVDFKKKQKFQNNIKDVRETKDIPRKRAKVLVSGLLDQIQNKQKTPIKRTDQEHTDNDIKVPQHFIVQLRRALGKGTQPKLETVKHVCKNIEELKEVMQNRNGIMIVTGEKKSDDEKLGPKKFELQELKQLQDLIDEKEAENVAFVTLMTGNKKVHCHCLGNILPKKGIIVALKTDANIPDKNNSVIHARVKDLPASRLCALVKNVMANI